MLGISHVFSTCSGRYTTIIQVVFTSKLTCVNVRNVPKMTPQAHRKLCSLYVLTSKPIDITIACHHALLRVWKASVIESSVLLHVLPGPQEPTLAQLNNILAPAINDLKQLHNGEVLKIFSSLLTEWTWYRVTGLRVA